MLSVSVNRIRDYLVLPELKGNEQDWDNNSEVESGRPVNVVIRVSNGKFQGGAPPEIPLPRSELQKIQSEKKKREDEAKDKAKQLIGKPSSSFMSKKTNSDNFPSSPPTSSSSSSSSTPSFSSSLDLSKPTLNNINVEILKGGLTMIIGFLFFWGLFYPFLL
jgi:hypothetical protein